jgi:hypothetical protein
MVETTRKYTKILAMDTLCMLDFLLPMKIDFGMDTQKMNSEVYELTINPLSNFIKYGRNRQ